MPQCHLLGHSSSLFAHNTVNCWLIVNITHSFNPIPRNYADAKEFCETAAKNGFKAGRLYEPKSQSFNDKVNAKLLSQTWIGITLVKQGPRKNRRQNTRTNCLGKCNWGTQWIMEIRSNE